jgi:hypothetical protein
VGGDRHDDAAPRLTLSIKRNPPSIFGAETAWFQSPQRLRVTLGRGALK